MWTKCLGKQGDGRLRRFCVLRGRPCGVMVLIRGSCRERIRSSTWLFKAGFRGQPVRTYKIALHRRDAHTQATFMSLFMLYWNLTRLSVTPSAAGPWETSVHMSGRSYTHWHTRRKKLGFCLNTICENTLWSQKAFISGLHSCTLSFSIHPYFKHICLRFNNINKILSSFVHL